jgi:hypothetical protein
LTVGGSNPSQGTNIGARVGFLKFYIVSTIIAILAVLFVAKKRGDFPNDLSGRLKVAAISVCPVINVIYGAVIVLFY